MNTGELPSVSELEDGGWEGKHGWMAGLSFVAELFAMVHEGKTRARQRCRGQWP